MSLLWEKYGVSIVHHVREDILTLALAKGSFCSWSRYFSRLKKVSKKSGVILHAFRSCMVILPSKLGLTMSSIYKQVKVNFKVKQAIGQHQKVRQSL